MLKMKALLILALLLPLSGAPRTVCKRGCHSKYCQKAHCGKTCKKSPCRGCWKY